MTPCPARIATSGLAIISFFRRHSLQAMFTSSPEISAAAGAAFDSATVVLEARIRDRPDDARSHSSLGRAYAGLGRKEEAIREGLRAVELLPISRDALVGPNYVLELAWIYAMVGEPEAAIEQLDRYLSVPANWSIEGLLHDPLLDLLRDHPRFQALVERHRRKDAGG